jgi:hypothetical protein
VEARERERSAQMQTEQPITQLGAEEVARSQPSLVPHVQAARSQNEARYAFAQERFDAEQRDVGWAPRREQTFVRALGADGLEPAFYEIECRQSLCRIEIPAGSSNAAYALKTATHFMTEVGNAAASGSDGEGEDRALVFFVPRDDATWP